MKKFNKEDFATILGNAYGSFFTNAKQFCENTGLTEKEIKEYQKEQKDEPPSVYVLKKISDYSFPQVSYELLLQVCGYIDENSNIKSKMERILEILSGSKRCEIDLILHNVQVEIAKPQNSVFKFDNTTEKIIKEIKNATTTQNK